MWCGMAKQGSGQWAEWAVGSERGEGPMGQNRMQAEGIRQQLEIKGRGVDRQGTKRHGQ